MLFKTILFARKHNNIYRAAKCDNKQVANKQLLLYVKFNQEYGNSTSTAFICCAYPQFNVLSCGLSVLTNHGMLGCVQQGAF